MADGPTFLEHTHRTRILLHLPLNDSRQHRAIFQIVDYLKSCREKGIGGFTWSVFSPPAFFGYWWDENETPPRLADDWIVICILDVPRLPEPIDELLADLQARIEEVYRAVGTPQKEIWVVAHPVIQFSSPPADQK